MHTHNAGALFQESLKRMDERAKLLPPPPMLLKTDDSVLDELIDELNVDPATSTLPSDEDESEKDSDINGPEDETT